MTRADGLLMPCVLLTYHAYGSWLPDRPQGFVHWRDGLLPTDVALANNYRDAMTAPATVFSAEQQQALIATARSGAPLQQLRVHAVACEPSHVHLLASWRDERPPAAVSQSVKANLTRRLNAQLGRRKWFSKGASKQPVRSQTHFDRLVGQYLPRHGGAVWIESDDTAT